MEKKKGGVAGFKQWSNKKIYLSTFIRHDFLERKRSKKSLCELCSLVVMSKMLHKSTKRQMNFNQHYKFKTMLQERCKSMKNTRLHIVNEAYTFKTCTKCGCIKVCFAAI